ncbi:MAG: DoxX family membrane protein [Acidobacteria bacterium]|nr:DoxX family membrane protein [Acidobacteriota bacterium]
MQAGSPLEGAAVAGYFMRHLPLIARVLLGLIFLYYGVIEFEPVLPPDLGPEASAFIGALMDSGYFWQLLKVLEIVCGTLLILGLFVPLMLIMLAPVVVNGMLFHILLSPNEKTLVVALTLVLSLYLAYQYRSSFRAVLQPRTQLG